MAKCGRRDMSRISRVSDEINDIEGIVAQVTVDVASFFEKTTQKSMKLYKF